MLWNLRARVVYFAFRDANDSDFQQQCCTSFLSRFRVDTDGDGWISTPALAAAVSNAGGLGGLGAWGFSAEDAERRIAGFRQQSAGSLNVNYPLWPKPEIAHDVSEPMRKRLQAHYDAKGLGMVPQAPSFPAI